jgi:cellulose synthase/poly-beta-1,6-N-acetylglucosamine synthase-like glycosyltransferase
MYFAIYSGMTLSLYLYLSLYIYLYLSLYLYLYIYILIPVCGQGTKCLEVLASAPFKAGFSTPVVRNRGVHLQQMGIFHQQTMGIHDER